MSSKFFKNVQFGVAKLDVAQGGIPLRYCAKAHAARPVLDALCASDSDMKDNAVTEQ